MSTSADSSKRNMRKLGGTLVRLLELYPIRHKLVNEQTAGDVKKVVEEQVNPPSPLKQRRYQQPKRNRVVNTSVPKQELISSAEVNQYLHSTKSRNHGTPMQTIVPATKPKVTSPPPRVVTPKRQRPPSVSLTPLVPTGEYVPSYDTRKDGVKFSLVGEPGVRCHSPLPCFGGVPVEDKVLEAAKLFANLFAACRLQGGDFEKNTPYGPSYKDCWLMRFLDISEGADGTRRNFEAMRCLGSAAHLPQIARSQAGTSFNGYPTKCENHDGAGLLSDRCPGDGLGTGGAFTLTGRRLVGLPLHDRRLNAQLLSSWEKGVKARLPSRKAFSTIKASCWWRLAGSREGLLLAARLAKLDADVYESLLTRWMDGIHHSYDRFLASGAGRVPVYSGEGNFVPELLGGRLGTVLPFSGSEAMIDSLFPDDVVLSDMLGIARQLGYLKMWGVLSPDEVARLMQCDQQTIMRELRRLILLRNEVPMQQHGIIPILEGRVFRGLDPGTTIMRVSKAILRAKRRTAAMEAAKRGRKGNFFKYFDVVTCSKVLRRRLQEIAGARPDDIRTLLEQLAIVSEAVSSGGLEAIKDCPEAMQRLQEIATSMPPDVQALLQQLGFLAGSDGESVTSAGGFPGAVEGRSEGMGAVMPNGVQDFLKQLETLSYVVTGEEPQDTDGFSETLQRRLQEIAGARPDDVRTLLEQLAIVSEAVSSGGLEAIKDCPEAMQRLQEIATSMPPDVQALLQQLGFLAGSDGATGIENLCEAVKRHPELSSEILLPSGGLWSPRRRKQKGLTEGMSLNLVANNKERGTVPRTVGISAAGGKAPIVHNVPQSTVGDQGKRFDAKEGSTRHGASVRSGKQPFAGSDGLTAFYADGTEVKGSRRESSSMSLTEEREFLRKRRRLKRRGVDEGDVSTDDDADKEPCSDEFATSSTQRTPRRYADYAASKGKQPSESLPTAGVDDYLLSPYHSPQMEMSLLGTGEDDASVDHDYAPRDRSKLSRSRIQPVFFNRDDEKAKLYTPSVTKDSRILGQATGILVFPHAAKKTSRAASVTSRGGGSDIASVKGLEDPWELSDIFANDESDLALFLATFPDEERHVQLRREAHRVLDYLNAGNNVLEEYAIKIRPLTVKICPPEVTEGVMSRREEEWNDEDEQLEKCMFDCRVDINSMVERFKNEAREEYADLWSTLLGLRERVKSQEALLENSKLDVHHLSYPRDDEDTDAFALRLTREVNAFSEEHKLNPQQLKELTAVKEGREAAVRSFLESFARTRGRRAGVSVGCQCTPKDLGYIDTEVQELTKQMEDLQYHARGLLNAIKLVVISTGNVLSFHSALELEATCKRCFCIFEDPRTLWPCGHSFCLHCLTQMISKGGELICDECGTLCLVGYTPNFAIEMVAGYQLMWINSAEDDASEDSLCSSPSAKSSLTSSISKSSKRSSHTGQKRRTVEKVLAGLLKDLLTAQNSGKAARKAERKTKRVSRSCSGVLPLPALKSSFPTQAGGEVQCS